MDISVQTSQIINGKTVTSRQLEALMAVEETGSQNSAAKKLGISVPVLHNYLAQIEEAAGEPILKTTPAGSKPTQAGAEIISIARSMNQRVGMERGFTICCSPVMEDVMMSVISSAKIRDAHIIISDDAYNIRLMRENKADLAIIDDPLFLFDAEEFQMDEIGYMGMVYVDNGQSFIRYKYGAQRVAFMYLDSIEKEYSVDAETFSLPELLGSNKSFFIEEFMLIRRNLRLKSAVDPKMLRHAITAIYRKDDSRISKIIKAAKSRNL